MDVKTRGKISIIISIALIGLALFSPSPVLAADNDGATAVIEDLNAGLLRAMKDGERLGYRGRYELLEPVIHRAFDLEFIARFSVGRYWRGLADWQRSALVERFSVMSVSTYASRFHKFSGERFEVISSKALKRGRTLVRTRLVKSNGDIIRMDYVLRERQGRHRIINIIVDGVSDLSLKRAQYTSIIKDDGFDALMAKLDEKIKDYSTETAE